MSLIISNEASCMYCYKCLRNCPVKSLSFSDGKTKVIEQECIECGTCILVCPQKAKSYLKHISQFEQILGKPFLISIAPSFFAHYDQPYKVISLLKKLGAIVVQETATGAELISKEYENEFSNGKTVITTACPVVVNLAEKYYPKVLDYLAPYVSPMTAHSILMKNRYGDFPIVFIGPCIAKKNEKSNVDIVLTFEELDEFIQKNKFKIDELPDDFPTPPYPHRARMYPTSGGINHTVNGEYRSHLSVEGLENISSIFSQIESVEYGFFIEASACVGSCINGPAIRKDISLLEKRRRIMNHIEKMKSMESKVIISHPSMNLSRTFHDKHVAPLVSQEQIQEVLKSLGKDDPKRQLNCGACGYETCREKAAAVVLNRAEKEMCVTYLVDKLKAATNRVVEESPNAIIIYKDKSILYKNKAAEQLLWDIPQQNLSDLLKQIASHPNQVYEIPSKGSFFIKTFKLPQDASEVLLMVDMTKERQQEERLKIIKQETLNKIEEMLSKQMRIAQEIAGLLGESIAETKSHFVELRKFMEE
ncbi:[Fe-Fe] hydrogenase large subunit C-terminal domain-containing protein [Thermotoga profunda]|uniref:[Fe-Fe] hydrogenase large subunit C-terminal domain-containing protein n=1 Tax=Thermotoga profunda TaxID=1508420 RepID=UPI000597307F|nr:[Fe-Fe] hydrogenase large subunit C-terminal domain-containing protein [Thermotoga profunda]